MRALSSLRGLRGSPAVPPLCRDVSLSDSKCSASYAGSTKTPRTSWHYGIEGFEECSSIRPPDVTFLQSATLLKCFGNCSRLWFFAGLYPRSFSARSIFVPERVKWHVLHYSYETSNISFYNMFFIY